MRTLQSQNLTFTQNLDLPQYPNPHQIYPSAHNQSIFSQEQSNY